MDIQDLLNRNESSWLDFKQQYHENKAEFVHDILCLANAYYNGDRYLVFGVSDNKEIIGVDKDAKRRKQANINDFLRQVNLNRSIGIELQTHKVKSVEIDVLKIYNSPDKPFFLTEDYKKGKKAVRSGVVYTRNGDTNTPLSESAKDSDVELMWRERFGFGLPPLRLVDSLLDTPKDWDIDECYIYNIWRPEFNIEFGNVVKENFFDEWTQEFHDSATKQFEVLLRYGSTRLRRYLFVLCDGGRLRFPTPIPNDEGDNEIRINSIEWKIANLLPQNPRYGSLREIVEGLNFINLT